MDDKNHHRPRRSMTIEAIAGKKRQDRWLRGDFRLTVWLEEFVLL